MTTPIYSPLERLAAGVAAEILTEKKSAILAFVDSENPVAVVALKQAIEKAEPGGLKMALVKGTLNQILDGLEDEEKAAVPTSVSSLIDWAISKATAIASG